MMFTEEWFGPESCAALANLVNRVRHLDGDIVEVGCWQGRSTIALANASWPALVHAVDTWQGSPGEVSAELAATRDVYAEFMENVEALAEGNIRAHRMGWRDYFDAFADRPVKFLHIDAEHTHREVFDNIERVRPLLVPGGVICGDDVHHPPVKQAVLDALGPSVETIATLWWWQ